MRYLVEVDGRQYQVEIDGERVLVDGMPTSLDVRQIGGLPLYSLLIGNESVEVSVEDKGHSQYNVMLAGELYNVAVRSEAEQVAKRRQPSREADGLIRAPMPGLVAALSVKVGERVSPGQTLVVLESMKMENPLQAPAAGTVAEVHVGTGDSVERNQPLVTLELEKPSPSEGGSHGSGGSEDG